MTARITWSMILRAAVGQAADRIVRWARSRVADLPRGIGAGPGLVRFRIAAITAAARHRRPGYLAAIRRATVIEREGWVWLDRAAADRIARGYTRGIPWWRLAASLAMELLAWVLAGGPITPAAHLDQRTRQCMACPDRAKDAEGKWVGCSLCGCRKVKLRLATARCPAGKWRAVRGVSAGSTRNGSGGYN